MKKIKKRGAIYGVIALLLCVAVYLNWSYIDAPEDLLVAEQTDPEDAGGKRARRGGRDGLLRGLASDPRAGEG